MPKPMKSSASVRVVGDLHVHGGEVGSGKEREICSLVHITSVFSLNMAVKYFSSGK